MYPTVSTKDPKSVATAVEELCGSMFPQGDRSFVGRAFGWAAECFEGRNKDYQAIDALYHDFEHTLQVTLCLGRLVAGMHTSGEGLKLSESQFQLVLLAILLHDTGYLKKRDDTEGTGAKYTQVHVARSAEFSRKLLNEKSYTSDQIRSVGNMIRCTGVNADLKSIPFQEEWEKVLGCALATADLLGQMAASDYVDKLPILFEEFAESARFQTKDPSATGMFASAEDLMIKTPFFWEKYVVPKITHDFGSLHKFLADPFPGGPNEYMERIEANIEILKKRVTSKLVVT